jgi:hypothetical protein
MVSINKHSQSITRIQSVYFLIGTNLVTSNDVPETNPLQSFDTLFTFLFLYILNHYYHDYGKW